MIQDYVLEVTDSLSAPDWQPAIETPVRMGDDWVVAVPSTSANKFYRLMKP